MKNGLSPKKNSTSLCQKVAKLLPVPLPKTMSKISALLLSIILLSLRNNSGTNSKWEFIQSISAFKKKKEKKNYVKSIIVVEY